MVYWKGQELVFENYILQTRISADPVVCTILHFCRQWRSFRELTAYLKDYEERSIRRALERLQSTGMLERSPAPPGDDRAGTIAGWASWNPAAGFFHFSTKDTYFAADQARVLEELKRKSRVHPMPVPVKRYPESRRRKLPRAATVGQFPQILLERRTWRKYGREEVSSEALATTLGLTFGIQGWVEVPGLGKAALKTSPSGGCLHPIEAYVLVQRVEGLRAGIYHYNAALHELEWIRRGLSRGSLERHLGNQWWFAQSAFLVLMTAVFGRTQWKYGYPRAYRAILLEAGHLCQTFCLTATWLGLAPFCTIAGTDTQWENWLGVDGIEESLVYVAGAGARPRPIRGAHIGMIGKCTAAPSSQR